MERELQQETDSQNVLRHRYLLEEIDFWNFFNALNNLDQSTPNRHEALANLAVLQIQQLKQKPVVAMKKRWLIIT